MYVLGVILCREGSKGLPRKAVLPLCGQPVITYTFEHAKASTRLDGIVLTTDSPDAATIAEEHGIEVIHRPAELATDGAPIDGAVRHAVQMHELHYDIDVSAVVILYGNVPVRPVDAIDDAIEHLIETGADSVRTVAPIGKQHPLWLHRLDGDRMIKYRENNVYRRQDLEPLYYHDGAVLAVTRRALFPVPGRSTGEAHAFLGRDRRALIVGAHESVDIDNRDDLLLAEALLRRSAESSRSSHAEKRASLALTD